MKYGIYYAYWETEWEANYIPYVDKEAALGFDALEIGAKPLPDYTAGQIAALKSCAATSQISLTAGYGPSYEHNIGSGDKAIRQNATADAACILNNRAAMMVRGRPPRDMTW